MQGQLYLTLGLVFQTSCNHSPVVHLVIYVSKYCHNLCVAIDGVRIGEWIYWPLIHTTLNYILQITNTHTHTHTHTSVLNLWWSALAVSWKGFYRGRIFSFPRSGPLVAGTRAELLSTVNSTITPSLLSLPCRAQLNWLPQLSSFLTPRRGLRKHRVPPITCVSFAAGMCLSSHCPETNVI
jgi:hypothetical protein